MSNFLKVSMKENIQQLSRQGLSIRRIAHYLNLNRRTVSKYIRGEVTSPVSCSTKVPLGSVGSKCTSPEGVPLGSVGSKCTSSGEVPLGSECQDFFLQKNGHTISEDLEFRTDE